jgi:hypothetical protein
MSKGKSDADILRHLGNVVGVGNETLTRAEQEKREKIMINKMTKELKRQGQDPDAIASKLLVHKGAEDFEAFTNRQAEMKYTEHEILYNKWVGDEKQRRLEERKAV